jgi:hypothetical protein
MGVEGLFPICLVASAALLAAGLYAGVVIPWRRQQEREIKAKEQARARNSGAANVPPPGDPP